MVRFVEENRELPKALLDLVAFCRSARGRDKLAQWTRLASGRRALLFAGMGTSEFTSEALAFRLSVKGWHARSFDAGELSRQEVERVPAGSCHILTSQSGESIEIRNLAAMPWIGPYVAVTNDEDSALARGAALTLPLCAGPEESITTKTYVNNLALFRVLEAGLEGEEAVGRTLEALERAAGAMAFLDESGIEAAADRLMAGAGGLPILAFAGRGDAVVSARQCGLTFMEGLKRPACAFAGGAFRHGPFECVGPGLGLVLFRSSPATAGLMDGMARDAARHGSPVVVFDACGQPALPGIAEIRLGTVPPAEAAGLFPILAARAHNQLLHVLATRLGIETGRFRYGSKVTRLE
jgi:glucosamine--fructose-6-phosphate aminotransferase (isomerizing)